MQQATGNKYSNKNNRHRGGTSRRSRQRSSNQNHDGRKTNNGSNVHNARYVFESNGPGIKLRGNAAQLIEKYSALAYDASGDSDYVLTEAFYQHAEHYARLASEFTVDEPTPSINQNKNNDTNTTKISDDADEIIGSNKQATDQSNSNDSTKLDKATTPHTRKRRSTTKSNNTSKNDTTNATVSDGDRINPAAIPQSLKASSLTNDQSTT